MTDKEMENAVGLAAEYLDDMSSGDHMTLDEAFSFWEEMEALVNDRVQALALDVARRDKK